jgi:hypothetical protein
MSTVVTTQTIPDWSSDIPQGVIWVQNRPDPIVVSEVRRFETGQLEVLTQTAAGETALKALLASPGPYLLQQPTFGTPDRYVTVGRVDRKRSINKASDLFRVWVLPLTQVARPPVAGWSVSIPGKTYADSTAAYPLYSNRTGTYLSRSS